MSILHTGHNVDLHFAQIRDLAQRVVLLEDGTGGVSDGTGNGQYGGSSVLGAPIDLQYATITVQSEHLANSSVDKLFNSVAAPYPNSAWATEYVTSPGFTMDTGVNPITVEVVKFYGTLSLDGGYTRTEGSKWPTAYGIYLGTSADGPWETEGNLFYRDGDYPPTTPQVFTFTFPGGPKTSRCWRIQIAGAPDGHRVNQAVFFAPA